MNFFGTSRNFYSTSNRIYQHPSGTVYRSNGDGGYDKQVVTHEGKKWEPVTSSDEIKGIQEDAFSMPQTPLKTETPSNTKTPKRTSSRSYSTYRPYPGYLPKSGISGGARELFLKSLPFAKGK